MNEVKLNKMDSEGVLKEGQIFVKAGEYYILSMVADYKYCLVSLINGNRWDEPCSMGGISDQIERCGFKKIPKDGELTIKCG